MDDLRTVHDDQVFQRSEALEHGYSDQDLQRGLRSGHLVRIRHGGYTFADVWAAADDLARHRLRAHAALRSHDVPVVLSHTSAAVEHGLRLFRPDLRKIHLLCLSRRMARSTGDIVYHRGNYHDDDIASVGAHPVVAPAVAALQAASLTDVAGGLVVLDSVIDLGKGTLDEIHAQFERISGHPFSRKLQISVRLTRKGANSMGESLSRHLMWCEHIPEPVLQFEIRDERGDLIGTTDFAWPDHGVLGEFDGMQKYGRLLRPGESAGDAVQREKIREDDLRYATGWLMVRLIWAELFKPGPTAAKIRAQLNRGRKIVIL